MRTRMLSIQANLCFQCMIRSVSPNRGSPPDRDTHTRSRDTGAHTHTHTHGHAPARALARTRTRARARARKRRGKQRMSMFMCLTIVYVSIALLQCSAIHCLLYCTLLHSTESSCFRMPEPLRQELAAFPRPPLRRHSDAFEGGELDKVSSGSALGCCINASSH